MRTVEGAERDRSIGTDAGFGLTRNLMTGAAVALDVGLTGLKYLNHELGTQLQSALSLSVSQPLWAGADPTVVMDDLIQAQHEVVYSLRSFARYEKTFAVEVASSYYNVLVQMDRVKNEWENYRNLTAAREQNQLRFEAGRIRRSELDQARQSELRAHNSYLTAIQTYEQRLDAFRVTLGLPTDAPVVLSRKDLAALAEAGIQGVEADEKAAADLALRQRLDLKNSRGAVEDADRAVRVAADALKGDVDFVGGINVSSQPETRAGRFMFHEGLYEFGLEVDLPLERLAERNAYRTSLINYNEAVRDYMEQVDEVKQSVRQSLRQLRRTKQTYQISEASVKLAEKRVSDTLLERDAGRAITRDLLESQEALVSAQNERTQALVSHLVARLEFQRDMELLEVDAGGQIHESDINAILRDQPPGRAADRIGPEPQTDAPVR
jgi:outer membrane protein TolC